jgi:hypothetical protein
MIQTTAVLSHRPFLPRATVAPDVLSTPPLGALSIRMVNSTHERESAFRLRYRVYVQELGFRQSHADHSRRIVEEPLDESADIFVAYLSNEVVGTVRSNMGAGCDFGQYAELYGMHQLGALYPARVAMTSKLIVDARYRNGRVFLELAHAVFRLGILRGMAADFIDCEQRLLPVYHRLGYRQTSEQPIEHPDLGPRYPMRLFSDRAYLESVRSPFLRNLQ